MKLVFDDNNLHLRFAPLTLTRPVAELRFGIMTIRESWCLFFKNVEVSYLTAPHLNAKFKTPKEDDQLILAGNIKPSRILADLVKQLLPGQQLNVNGKWIASYGKNIDKILNENLDELLVIENLWDIFQKNDQALKLDFELLTSQNKSSSISTSNQIIGTSGIFLEEGAKVECAILNATEGPIYIGKNAEVMEGSMIRGPFALCDYGTVKMGAKIYGATTIGPYCKVGGEIANTIFQAYSNKGHDGFIGNSVVGEWCNLGADTNSSNLMNTYGKLKIYSYETQKMELTDVTFCGVLMGDHVKTGINTMLNTATVIGVSANVFGSGFPIKYIPSFTWGGTQFSEKFLLDKAFEVAQNMMQRRNLELTPADKKILTSLFEMAQ